MAFGGSHKAYLARCKLGGYKGGPKRAAFWRTLGFPNLERARIARWDPAIGEARGMEAARARAHAVCVAGRPAGGTQAGEVAQEVTMRPSYRITYVPGGGRQSGIEKISEDQSLAAWVATEKSDVCGGFLYSLRATGSAGYVVPHSGANSVFPTWRRPALANKVRQRRLEEWKRKELQRTPFAILDEPPAELRPTKGRK